MTDTMAKDAVAPGGGSDSGIAAVLFACAIVAWWWSARMAADMDAMSAMGMAMPMSVAAYLGGWAAMMAAMMFPAIFPVVRVYARASGRGVVAPLPFFVGGYLVVWSAAGLPAYFAWRALSGPLAAGEAWVGRLAGAVLLGAAAYQLTPLKRSCLHHCRSPMSLFLQAPSNLTRPTVAIRLGATHGAYCLGCCWALMAVLVSVGTMHIAWMAMLALVIALEKLAPGGTLFATFAALLLAAVGLLLLIEPSAISTLT